MLEAKKVNHIGIAVRSIESHQPFYEYILDAEFEHIEEVADQGVKVGFFRLGDVRLELLEPLSEDSTIATFIENKGEGLHHVAYNVDNLAQRLQSLKDQGVRLIDETPRQGAHDMQVAFLHPKATHGVLTELCEPAASIDTPPEEMYG
jgi:methylmalonyl-CoA/ethylmalonyl-CoA epimerase